MRLRTERECGGGVDNSDGCGDKVLDCMCPSIGLIVVFFCCGHI